MGWGQRRRTSTTRGRRGETIKVVVFGNERHWTTTTTTTTKTRTVDGMMSLFLWRKRRAIRRATTRRPRKSLEPSRKRKWKRSECKRNGRWTRNRWRRRRRNGCDWKERKRCRRRRRRENERRGRAKRWKGKEETKETKSSTKARRARKTPTRLCWRKTSSMPWPRTKTS